MKKDKVVLAYSGGLDTSIILKWLVNKGFEVICFVGDVGQSDDFNLVKEKALELGAKEVHIKDLQVPVNFLLLLSKYVSRLR